MLPKSLGILLDFSWLLYPSSKEEYSDLANVSVESFKEHLNAFHFSPKNDHDLKQLLFEYTEMCQFAFKAACDYRGGNYSFTNFNQHVFKQFISSHSEKCPVLYRFLSFVVALPTSEAIVESWGSSIDHLHKIKPHTSEVTDKEDLTSETGTVDKFAFIKLNGPPPGLGKNVKILKAALNVMFKDNFAKHFTHAGSNLKLTSKVVSKILNGNDKQSVLPCFY